MKYDLRCEGQNKRDKIIPMRLIKKFCGLSKIFASPLKEFFTAFCKQEWIITTYRKPQDLNFTWIQGKNFCQMDLVMTMSQQWQWKFIVSISVCVYIFIKSNYISTSVPLDVLNTISSFNTSHTWTEILVRNPHRAGNGIVQGHSIAANALAMLAARP